MTITEIAGGTRGSVEKAWQKVETTVQTSRQWIAEGREPVGRGLPVQKLEINDGPPIEYTDDYPDVLKTDVPVVVISGLMGKRPKAAINGLLDQGMRVLWVADKYIGRTTKATDNPMIVDQKALQNALLIETICQKEKIPQVHVVGHSLGGNVAMAVGDLFDPELRRPEPPKKLWKSRFPQLAEKLAPSSSLADTFFSLRETDDTNTQRIRSFTILHSPGLLTDESRTLVALTKRAMGRPAEENHDGKQYLITHPIKGMKEFLAIRQRGIVQRAMRYLDEGIPIKVYVSANDALVPEEAVQISTPNVQVVEGGHCTFLDDRKNFGETVGGFLKNIAGAETTVFQAAA